MNYPQITISFAEEELDLLQKINLETKPRSINRSGYIKSIIRNHYEKDSHEKN
jgi:hypothetical protein